MIHIYTGDGKGKTTACIGLAVRACGAGKKAVIVQFMKGRESGEVSMLERLGITVLRNSRDYGFFSLADDESKAAMISENNENLDRAITMIKSGDCDFLILDEAFSAYNQEALNRAAVDGLLDDCENGIELALTGREPPGHFVEKAHYVSEINKIKHPYDSGITARRGVEY